VPLDRASAPTQARNFALRLIGWALGLFGLFRLPWTTAHVVWPATQLQAAAAVVLAGPAASPIEATLACSGADALALCVAAIVAYPASWARRLSGIALGTAAILALNIVRIGTLGRAAASPRWFDALHLYIWPLLLTIAIAAIVFTWMRAADRGDRPAARVVETAPPLRLSMRFAATATICLLIFAIASPLYLESPRVLAAAMLVARAAALLLRGIGMDARAAAGVLTTPRGAFLVTTECISTPLIPVYLAGVLVFARTRWQAVALIAAGAPLFVAVGVARLLVVAMPPALGGSPAFLIHAFSQILVGVGMVIAVALWRSGAKPATFVRAAAALLLALAAVELGGRPYTSAIFQLGALAPADPQNALMSLPAFQLGLFLALWVAAFGASGWARLLAGACLLAAVQIAVSGGVHFLSVHAGIEPLVRDVRAWALIGPALVILTVIHVAPARD
jgi:exosortase/archaeosortase family protein